MAMESYNPQKTRVAWITFDFPPRQSSGVFRAIKFYKYLDKSRFEVDFITHGPTRRFRRATMDESLLAEVHPAAGGSSGADRNPARPGAGARSRAGATAQVDRRPRSRRAAPPNRRPEAPTSARPARTRAAGAIAGSHSRRISPTTCSSGDGWPVAGGRPPFPPAIRSDLHDLLPRERSSRRTAAAIAGREVGCDYRYGGPLWIKHIVGYRKSALRERMDHWFQRRVLRSADLIITQSERIRR